MTTQPPIDYHAEVTRSRAAQGLPPHLPQHLLDAVEALVSAADRQRREAQS